jgi:hypothetical protein
MDRVSRGSWCALVVAAATLWGGFGLEQARGQEPVGPAQHRLDDVGLVEATVMGGVSDRGSARLMDVAVGDLNGDGFADLVVGAPGYDPNGLASAGSVFVLMGRRDLPLTGADTVDLSDLIHFDVRIDGVDPGAQLGTRVAIADVTGDGVADLVMTSPGGRGEVYVKAGGKASVAADGEEVNPWRRGVVAIDQPQGFDWSFEGEREGAMLGAVLCVGDLTADKYADLVFGGLEFDDQGALTATALYAVPGRASWSKRVYSGSERVPGRVRLVRALGHHSRAMHTCAIGDLDDDGTGDLIAGMPLDNLSNRAEVGSVAVIFDALTRSLGTIDLGDPDAAFGLRIVGDQAGGHFGQSLAVGDFNGDHRADLAVGVPGRAVSKTATSPEGMVMLFWGRMQRGVTPKAPNRVLVGSAQAPVGMTISALDIIDDEALDLVLYSPTASGDVGPSAGRLDIYAGGEHMRSASAEAEVGVSAQQPGLRLLGAAAGQSIGYALAVGDLNGDGVAEWALRGAWHPLGRSSSGSVSVLSAPPQARAHNVQTHEVLLPLPAPLTLLGPGRGGSLAAKMIANADLDGDGKPDMIWLSPEGAGRSGVACVQYSTGPQAASLSRSIADADGCDLRITSPPGSRLSSLSVGDFNGDRHLDLALGMDDHVVNGQPVGAVVVMPLPARDVREVEVGQDPKQQWWWSGGPANEGLGADVRLADYDGDGVDDLLMAADRASYDDIQQAGALLIVRGSTLAPDTRSAVKGEGVTLRFEGSDSGHMGLGAQTLDFDADGAPDLLIPAPTASPGGRDRAGAAYVIYSVARLKTGRYSVDDDTVAALRLVGPSARSNLEHACDVTDLDGDGIDDLLLQAPLANLDGGERGSIHVIYGRHERIGPYIDLGRHEGNDLIIVGERLSGRLSGPVVGDINGDGARDLIVSAQWAGALGTGRAYVLLADPAHSFKGYVRLDQPAHVHHILHGVEPHAGLSLPSMLPDLNNDGFHELWLISRFADGLRSDQGRAMRLAPLGFPARPQE